MNLDTLKLFCDVVRYQSFSRGAAQNNVSQSAASQAIHQLERLYNAQLIDRSKRPFVVTPEGQACHSGFKDMLERFEMIDATVRSLRKEIAGTVRVASIYSVGLHDMGRAMTEFMTEYPKAHIRLQYLRPNKVYDAVTDEEVDLGIISYPTPSKNLTVVPLRAENMVVVCSPEHRLAQMTDVAIEELQDERFIAFDEDLSIRKELDRYLRQKNVAVDIAMEFDNIETIKQAIRIGIGISILPEPTVRREIEVGYLVAVPLAITELKRPLGIIHRKRKMFTPTIIRFVELLKRLSVADEKKELEQISS